MDEWAVTIMRRTIALLDTSPLTPVPQLVPVVAAYVAWSYWVFRARVGPDDVSTRTGLPLGRIRLGGNFLAG